MTGASALNSPIHTPPTARWRVYSPTSWLRTLVTVYAVPSGTPWLKTCPRCETRLLQRRGPAVTARGRCGCCQAVLGRAPWVVEVGVVVVVGALLAGPRSASELVAYLWFAVLGVVLAVVDATARRLPNILTAAWAGGTLCGLVAPTLLEHRGGHWWRALLAGLVLMSAFALLALLRPGAMGWGDVKAAAAAGVALGWLGWTAVYAGMLTAFLLASVYAVVLLARRRASRGSQLAFGPFLVAGALIVAVVTPAAG